MVTTKEIEIYTCPYCNEKYDDYDDASHCRDECVYVESLEEDSKTVYICEHCGKEFKELKDAETCEESHHPLELAAKHKFQKKLIK